MASGYSVHTPIHLPNNKRMNTRRCQSLKSKYRYQFFHRTKARTSMPTAPSKHTNVATLGMMPAVRLASELPLLVLPCRWCAPPWPLEVAIAAGSTVAVLIWADYGESAKNCSRTPDRLTNRVTAVVAKVAVEVGSESANAASDKKTSAKPGAGTLTLQTLLFWSQGTVSIASSPLKRPSHSNFPPSVCRDVSVRHATIVYWPAFRT